MKTLILTAVLLLALPLASRAVAYMNTNGEQLDIPLGARIEAATQQPGWAQRTSTDVSQVAEDLGLPKGGAWLKSLLELAAVLVGAARVLRKAVPDDKQKGNFWQAVAHTALEVNPTLNAKPAGEAAPAVQAKPS